MIATTICNKTELSEKDRCAIQSYLSKGYKFYLYIYHYIENLDFTGEFYVFSANKIIPFQKYSGKRDFKKQLQHIHKDYTFVDLIHDVEGRKIDQEIMKNIQQNKKIWIIF